jgi:hypothetical protein
MLAYVVKTKGAKHLHRQFALASTCENAHVITCGNSLLMFRAGLEFAKLLAIKSWSNSEKHKKTLLERIAS